ncbi:hypothetical protein RDABS01_000360 [Bienertia sinuspersici]
MGWLKEAAQVIDMMTHNNLLPDVWTYNMLINGKRDEMERLKLPPNEVTYNTLINGCHKFKDSKE